MTQVNVDEAIQRPDFEQSRQFGEAVEFGATTTQYNEYSATQRLHKAHFSEAGQEPRTLPRS